MDWIYYRLLNDEARIVGFLRVKADRRQYVSLLGHTWRTEALEYFDAIRLAEAPTGLGYVLEEPQ